LKQVSLAGQMFKHFDEYIARLVFSIPIPQPDTLFLLYLP